MKPFIILTLLTLTIFMFGSVGLAKDPREIIPTHNESQYWESGFFGKKPAFSENSITLLNYIDWKAEQITNLVEKQHLDNAFSSVPVTTIQLSELAYGVGEATCEEGFGIIGDTLQSADLSWLTQSYWQTSTPTTLWEAIERLAKAASNSGASPIPE